MFTLILYFALKPTWTVFMAILSEAIMAKLFKIAEVALNTG